MFAAWLSRLLCRMDNLIQAGAAILGMQPIPAMWQHGLASDKLPAHDKSWRRQNSTILRISSTMLGRYPTATAISPSRLGLAPVLQPLQILIHGPLGSETTSTSCGARKRKVLRASGISSTWPSHTAGVFKVPSCFERTLCLWQAQRIQRKISVPSLVVFGAACSRQHIREELRNHLRYPTSNQRGSSEHMSCSTC